MSEWLIVWYQRKDISAYSHVKKSSWRQVADLVESLLQDAGIDMIRISRLTE